MVDACLVSTRNQIDTATFSTRLATTNTRSLSQEAECGGMDRVRGDCVPVSHIESVQGGASGSVLLQSQPTQPARHSHPQEVRDQPVAISAVVSA